MDKDTRENIKQILVEIRELRKDVEDLKRFKNRVLGGLAVFVFVLQSICTYVFK